MQHLRRILIAVALASVAACGQQRTLDAPATVTPLPTTPAPPTLPPSWTPGPPPTRAPASEQGATPTVPEPQAVEGRPTLPPSWTPQVIPTVTRPPFAEPQTPLATQPPPTITPVAVRTSPFRLPGGRPPGGPPTPDPQVTYLPACASFGRVAPTNTNVFANASARITWTPVEGAEGYRVWVLNPSNRYSFDQVTTETTITIPGEVFIGPGPYAWEVMPLLNGDRLCASLTGVFNVRLAL